MYTDGGEPCVYLVPFRTNRKEDFDIIAKNFLNKVDGRIVFDSLKGFSLRGKPFFKQR